jgi:hypothetical protein
MGFSATTDIDNFAIDRGVLTDKAFTMCLGDFLYIRFQQSEANHKHRRFEVSYSASTTASTCLTIQRLAICFSHTCTN